MGQVYEQLSIEERCRLSQMRQEGSSIRKIAAALDRSPSTMARELKRNLSPASHYLPSNAQLLYKSRRWRDSKLLRNPLLQQKVLNMLQQRFSPEQVSARIAIDPSVPNISHESIYRFLYAQIKRTKDYSWRHFLPRSKAKRGYRGRKGGPSYLTIQHRVSIHQRPAHSRADPGHWEADLMSFSDYNQHFLVLHDRQSRLLMLFNQPSKSAAQISDKLLHFFQALPKPLRQSITFDNGSEFALHYRLNPCIQTFFCDPYSPWQKGSVENAIGRLRRVLPRKTNLDSLSHKHILALNQAYNHTPRKCLGYKTPAEVFLAQLLHFKCEFTFPLPRE